MPPLHVSRRDRDRQWALLNFEHRSKRVERKFKLTANTKQWEERVSESTKAGRNVFVGNSSQAMAKKIAGFCEQHNSLYKSYTGEKSCAKDKKADFLDIDTALEGIQVVIATTCLSVAVDIKRWHCGDAFIYSMGGCDCGERSESSINA